MEKLVPVVDLRDRPVWPGGDRGPGQRAWGAGSCKGAVGSTLGRRPWEGFLEEETEQRPWGLGMSVPGWKVSLCKG